VSTTELTLWPGLLPLAEAAWARESVLVAADGALQVRRGRRVEQHDVRGCLMRPAGPTRALDVGAVVVFEGPDGLARCAIDLADWVPAGLAAPDRWVGRRLGEPFVALRDALAAAVGATVSSREWTAELPPLVSATDRAMARVRQVVLLALAVIAVVAPLAGSTVVGVVGGLAATGLVLLGLSPVRRWHPRSSRPRWRCRAGRLRDEVSLAADADVVWVMTTETRRAGAVPIGSLPWQADRLDVGADAMQLSTGAVVAVDLSRATWGPAFDTLRADIAAIDGVRERQRSLDRRVHQAITAVRGTHRPGSIGGDLALSALAAVAALATWTVSPAVAVTYGIASAAALALAGELAASARRPRRRGA
jgi:hypothetical protein